MRRFVGSSTDTDVRIADVTAEERLHPVIAVFRDAPEDDEPFTAAHEDALTEVRADRTAGVPRISYVEIMRKHGGS